MSMSQEEIESLMNGLDFDDDSLESESEENESPGNMSEDDINQLIAQTAVEEEKKVPTSKNIDKKDESIDEILSNLEDIDSDESISEDSNIDEILKELENDNPKVESMDVQVDEVEEIDEIVDDVETTDDIDALLSSIDGIKDDAPKKKNSKIYDEDFDLDHKINSGVFPLPVEEDTKVVNQLSAVASDSEEKATKIFDVLSNILDYNNAIQSDIQALTSFNERQVAMLSSLSKKFPNIAAFEQNLSHALQMSEHINDANEKLNDGNTEIFQAMELMQYHDINRQKIERVMSVIRKLSTYLNNLFEDENNRTEVTVARHIHGDKSTDDLVDDADLEALIAEFNK